MTLKNHVKSKIKIEFSSELDIQQKL